MYQDVTNCDCGSCSSQSLIQRFAPAVIYVLLYATIVSTVFTHWCCRITLLYTFWYLYDRDTSLRGGNRLRWVRRLKFFQQIAGYFPITLEKTADLDPNHKYILANHPHGAFCLGAFVNFATDGTVFTEKFPGITPYLLTHPFLHQLPLQRELFAFLGICDVSKESIRHILQNNGNMAVIVVGGMREAAMTDDHVPYIVLKNRKGFVKVALEHGAHLVPSYSFGENRLYKVRLRVFNNTELGWFRKLWKFLFGYPPVLTEGNCGMIPYRVPVHTIVGKPIFVQQDTNPSQEKIDALHARYVNELILLFETHKHRFGYQADNSLVFVE